MINEEALLFAKFLRDERIAWNKNVNQVLNDVKRKIVNRIETQSRPSDSKSLNRKF